MKKHLLSLATLFLMCIGAMAQSNLVIFSEDGDAFYAYVNGVRQNDQPLTNVKVTGLSQSVSLRVEFADKAKPQLKQSMMLEPGYEFAVRIKTDAKKQMKLRPFGQTPIASAQATGATEVAYHSTENSGTTYNTAGDNSGSAGITALPGNSNVSITSSTTTSMQTGMPGDVSVNINMSGTGMNMNVSGMDNAATMNTTTSTTVTSSSSSSSSSYGSSSAPANGNGYDNSTRDEYAHKQRGHHEGCRNAMSPAGFATLKKNVADKPFSDTKMSTAKVATKNACLSTAQIKEICKLFSMDDDKLAYAKYAYDYCADKANYYTVSEVFSFSSTTDEFNKFLEQ